MAGCRGVGGDMGAHEPCLIGVVERDVTALEAHATGLDRLDLWAREHQASLECLEDLVVEDPMLVIDNFFHITSLTHRALSRYNLLYTYRLWQ